MKVTTRILRSLLNRIGYELIRMPKLRNRLKLKIEVNEVAFDKPTNTQVEPTDFSLDLIHAENPYVGFDENKYPVDERGWGSHTGLFQKLIAEVKPRLIIEVGTWKGASAIEMADILDSCDLACSIVCVDTWLGAIEFWTNQADSDRFRSLGLKHGYPTVYYQFLANVKRRNHERRIVPFPQTSAIAGRWFQLTETKAQLIYIDASHDEEDVYQDLVIYSQCLDEGGILFGDDYNWAGVRRAVDRFAASQPQLTTVVEDSKWWFKAESQENRAAA